MKRIIAATLVASFIGPSVALAVDSKGASYFGGTAPMFKDAKNPVDGRIDTRDDKAFAFVSDDKNFHETTLSIPYDQVIDLEYGQKAGRRVGAAVATTVLLGPIGLLTLMSKKRKHFLTIGYKDAQGADQVAILELGKDIIRTTLPIVETRSGKKVVYQDDEAKKSAGR